MEQKSNTKKSKSIRVNLSFNKKQIELIDNLVGEYGDKRADVVKSIFLSWLSEKNITPDLLRKRLIEKNG